MRRVRELTNDLRYSDYARSLPQNVWHDLEVWLDNQSKPHRTRSESRIMRSFYPCNLTCNMQWSIIVNIATSNDSRWLHTRGFFNMYATNIIHFHQWPHFLIRCKKTYVNNHHIQNQVAPRVTFASWDETPFPRDVQTSCEAPRHVLVRSRIATVVADVFQNGRVVQRVVTKNSDVIIWMQVRSLSRPRLARIAGYGTIHFTDVHVASLSQ